jgi:hypothetical protein
MRTFSFSFILAFAFILAGPPQAGSADSNLPGPGTFSYNGSVVDMVLPHTLVANATLVADAH